MTCQHLQLALNWATRQNWPPVVIGELMEIVRKLNEDGITLLVVEQSLNIAAQLCSRAIFLEKGEVRFAGECAELLEQDDIARAVFFGGADS